MASGLVVLAVAGYSQDYMGAGAVLRQVEERNGKAATQPAAPGESAQLRQDMQTFSQMGTNLAPADAAKRWLEFVDRAVKIQRRINRDPNESPIESADVLAALPPPETWNELAKTIAARPAAKKGTELHEMGLQLLAAVLTGNLEQRKQLIAELQTRAKDENAQTAYLYQRLLNEVGQALLRESDDPDITLKILDRQLSQAGNSGNSVEIPNLVAQVGKENAEAFLRKALLTPKITLEFQQPNETSRLAQSLALELMDQLKTPQWGLVNSLDIVELYEALDKRFGQETNQASALPEVPGMDVPANDDYQARRAKDMARTYYLMGLISRDRPKDAVAVARKIGGHQEYYFEAAFKAMEQAGYASALDSFFYELLSQDPTLSFWDQYVDLAAKAGQTGRMLALVQAKLAQNDLSDEKKATLRKILFKAELAADNVEDGVNELRRLIADAAVAESRYGYESRGDLAVRLAHIGILMQKPEWTEEGISAANKWLAAPGADDNDNYDSDSVRRSLAQILSDLKRGPEAESVLADALAHSKQNDKKRHDYDWDNYHNPNLAALAALYHQAGRDGDVLTLLEQSPDWKAKDLAELFASLGREDSSDSLSQPVPYLAASALLADGRKEQARKIIYELLNQYPGLDRGYELLLSLDDTNAIPKLDELFARDQFEERPLIWKGHLLRQQGRLEEAEKVIRQAVAIDPSDGDEGRGDRMRVYAELAETRDARGDKKEADFYREVVKAIRISEDADQFYAAGLLKRAIAMYETALDHFSDAYCIQSRLAVQMADLGMMKEAEEHYRRAYELMPDSFGRVESHCFGCERAFDGERAQSIAEKVFSKLASEHPDKPQIHYLLGYLRQEQERFSEARTNYLTAVRLDPEYLNAWIKLQEVSADLLVSPWDRDEMTFNILRLDPLRRHSRDEFARVHDLAGLWRAVSAADEKQPVPASNLLALPASKLALDKKAASADEESTRMQMTMERARMDQSRLSPGDAVAENAFVQFAGQMFLSQAYGLDDE